jgi:hypothetical protein
MMSLPSASGELFSSFIVRLHTIDQGAFVVIQMTSALFVGGLQENLLRPPQLSEGFVRAKFPRSLTSEPGRYVVPSVLHFFAL